jgi:hypothetical protein
MSILWQWLSQGHWSQVWPWLALFLLGAYHGINPGMGWLFAVSLGLQEKSRRAVLSSLTPLLLGHMISIGMIVGAVSLLQLRFPRGALRAGTAAVLVSFGISRLIRSRHPRWARWVGMRVGFRDLTLWSFMMASAHGAGLMLAPVFLAWPGAIHDHGPDAMTSYLSHSSAHGILTHHITLGSSSAPVGALGSAVTWLLPVGIHTAGYLVLTAAVALLVFERWGIAILRRGWFNLDFIWAAALVATGLLTLLV